MHTLDFNLQIILYDLSGFKQMGHQYILVDIIELNELEIDEKSINYVEVNVGHNIKKIVLIMKSVTVAKKGKLRNHYLKKLAIVLVYTT